MIEIDFTGEITYREACRQAAEHLSGADIEESALDARLLLYEAAGWNGTRYLLHCDEPMTEAVARRYQEMICRRACRIPMQHIIGSQEFYGLIMHTNPDALIPRADTEVLVEEALAFLKNREQAVDVVSQRPSQHKENIKTEGLADRKGRSDRMQVLDLCTGTGCIAIALAKNFPRAGYTATDLSEAALALAVRNADEHGVDIRLLQGDLFDALVKGKVSKTGSKEENGDRRDGSDHATQEYIAAAGVRGADRFDLIVSNPPYISDEEIRTLAPEVRDHDPYMALSGGKDGLAIYRRLIPEAYEHLKEGGMLWLEIGADQGESVSHLMRLAGFTEVTVKKDLSGLDRIVGGIHV